uniref:Uncharacterized protein n=1 Tax=Helianthus annuus TaxID=4232 RepID=A0A251SSU3_HELAN
MNPATRYFLRIVHLINAVVQNRRTCELFRFRLIQMVRDAGFREVIADDRTK